MNAIKLIAARELKVKLRDKTFLFSTLFFLLIAVGSTVLPARGGETIRPRCPLPIGVTMSMTRDGSSSAVVSRTRRELG